MSTNLKEEASQLVSQFVLKFQDLQGEIIQQLKFSFAQIVALRETVEKLNNELNTLRKEKEELLKKLQANEVEIEREKTREPYGYED